MSKAMLLTSMPGTPIMSVWRKPRFFVHLLLADTDHRSRACELETLCTKDVLTQERAVCRSQPSTALRTFVQRVVIQYICAGSEVLSSVVFRWH